MNIFKGAALALTGALLLSSLSGCGVLPAGASPRPEPSVSTEPQSTAEPEVPPVPEPSPPSPADYLALEFAWPERLERYQAYWAEHPELTAEETVVQVNIGLDTSPYENPELVEEPESLTVLVNQYHVLPADYVPQLVYLPPAYTNQRDRLRPEAYEAFVQMVDAAAQEGLHIYNASAYRSYTTQKWVYQRYVRQEGIQAADTYSARPGCSEHQTGLVLDINTASFSDRFEETEEYAWLVENCWRYGFLLRFPEGKEALTGYQFEPWHYRYVGLETAQLCFENDWTLEEYHARQPVPEWDVP